MEATAKMGKISRRQSLPETMLSVSASGMLFRNSQGDQDGLLATENKTEGQLGLDPSIDQAIEFPKTFNLSGAERFSKSKRKSQSLYEPNAHGPRVNNSDVKGLLPNDLNGEGTDEGADDTTSDHSDNSHSREYTGMNDYLLEEKHAKPEEEHGEDGELDFLLNIPKSGFGTNVKVATSSGSTAREQKIVRGDADENMFMRSGVPMFQDGARKARRSIHETRPSMEPLVGSYDPGFYGYGTHHDDAFHQPAGVSSLPTFSSPYDNFATFNPLNNFQPYLTAAPVNAFQMNPLNNFGVNGLPYEHFSGFANMSLDAGNEVKKRRSRVPSSVYRGVSRCGKDNKFQARIRVHGKVKYLGRFKTEIEAAKCYDKHAIEYLGVNAQTNFPYNPTTLQQPTSST